MPCFVLISLPTLFCIWFPHTVFHCLAWWNCVALWELYLPWRALCCLPACTFDVSVLCPDVLITSLDQPGVHILSLSLLITLLVLCLDQSVLLYPTYCFCIYFFYRFLFSSFLSPFSYMSYLWYMIPIGLNIDLVYVTDCSDASNLKLTRNSLWYELKYWKGNAIPYLYISSHALTSTMLDSSSMFGLN